MAKKSSIKMGKAVKNEKYLGSINVNSDNIKEVKDWGIGDKITLEVEIEVNYLSQADKWDIENEGKNKDSIQCRGNIKTVKLVTAS